MGRMRDDLDVNNDEPYLLRRQNLDTEAPTTTKTVDDLIARKDTEYPGDPARNVCNRDGARTQLRPESGTPGASGFGIRGLCSLTNTLGSANTTGTG